MSIKGYPSQKKELSKLTNYTDEQSKTTSEFVTVQQNYSNKVGLDVNNQGLARLHAIAKTAEANTVDVRRVLKNTGHGASKGDVVRFESTAANPYFEAQVLSVPDANTIILANSTSNDIALGDSFFILRYVSQRFDQSGSIVASSGPIQYNLNGTDTVVFQDTTTPANSKPLPTQYLNTSGVRTNLGTEATLQSIDTKVSTAVPDVTSSGSITTTQSVAIAVNGQSTFSFQVTGTWVGSIVVEGTIDGTNWLPTTYVSLATGGVGTSFSANTIGQGNCTGLTQVRLRGNTLSSGSAVVSMRASDGVATFMLDNPIPIGSNVIGKVGIDQTTPGTTNGVQVNAALPAGSNIIGNIRIDQTTPGTTNGVQINAALPSGTNTLGYVGTAGVLQSNAPVYNVYSSTNVTTAAYVQLVASTTAKTNSVRIFDSSGQSMILAVGGAGAEVIQLYVPAGGDSFPLTIPAGSRVSYKALTGNATTGYLIINFLG